MLRAIARTLRLGARRNESDPTPLFRSRYGGLWVDRADAMQVLERKLRDREVTAGDAGPLRHYIESGYVIFEKAVRPEVIDAYLEFFEGAWSAPPNGIYAHSGGQVHPLSRELYDRVAKVSDLHYYFPRAQELIFAPAVKRFLEAIYERPAVVFQTMSMRKGSEEPLHIDTGPLTLAEPMSLAASWIALEDVREGAGALQFVPGSHQLPMPLGVMATFYDFSKVNYVPYPGGGWRLDRIDTRP